MKDYQQLRNWPNVENQLEAMDFDDQNAWPLVSLVTPSFNQASYLEYSILSVVNQGYPNLEYWVNDGGSTDSSLDIIQKYSRHLTGWKSQPDSGQTEAINQAWRAARGKYIGWLNSDDMLTPGSLAAGVTYLEQNPDIDVVYGDLYIIDDLGRLIERYEYDPFDLAKMLFREQDIPQPGTLLRREVLQDCGLLDTNLHYLMDLEYWQRIGLAGKRLGYNPQPLALFRVYDDSKTQAGSARAVEERKLLAQKVLEHPNCPLEIKRDKRKLQFNVSMASSRTWLKQGRFGRAMAAILQAVASYPIGLLESRTHYALLLSVLGIFFGWERWASFRARIRRWRRSRS